MGGFGSGRRVSCEDRLNTHLPVEFPGRPILKRRSGNGFVIKTLAPELSQMGRRRYGSTLSYATAVNRRKKGKSRSGGRRSRRGFQFLTMFFFSTF